MERLGIITGVLSVLGVFIMGGAFYESHKANQENIADQAIYTTSFTTSRTGTEGDVLGVYGNEAGTRAFVMMNVGEGSLPGRAEDFEVYASGMKNDQPAPMAQVTVGSVYRFGNTPYLGVLLEAPEGFNLQLVNLTIRSKVDVQDTEDPSAKAVKENGWDETFIKHDQWRVVLNPGASRVQHIAALDDEDIDARSLFYDTVTINEESEFRGSLDKALIDLNAYMKRIKNFEDQLPTTMVNIGNDVGVRLVQPNLPKELVGDKIEGLSPADVTEAINAGENVDLIDKMSQTAWDVDELAFDGSKYRSTYVFTPGTVVNGGYDFNWKLKSLREGYFDDVVPSGQNPAEYITNMANIEAPKIDMDEYDWTTSTGKKLSDYEKENSPSIKPLIDLKNNLTQAYEKYYSTKELYERSQLQQLLNMELVLDSTADATTVVSGDEAVTFNR